MEWGNKKGERNKEWGRNLEAAKEIMNKNWKYERRKGKSMNGEIKE